MKMARKDAAKVMKERKKIEMGSEYASSGEEDEEMTLPFDSESYGPESDSSSEKSGDTPIDNIQIIDEVNSEAANA